MKKIKVICCNDSIEAAVADVSNEVEITERLAKEHYEKAKYNIAMGDGVASYDEYRKICYWHIHEIPILNK